MMFSHPTPKAALLLAAVALLPFSAFSQGIQRFDPALDQLIDLNTAVERVATGFNTWTEGPVWTREKSLLFAEIPSNNIIQWRPGQAAAVFLHPSGYKGATPFTGPQPGSNGMTLDSRGRLTVAGHAGRDIWRMETLDPKGKITILADKYNGQPLNSPNDLVYKSDGSLYFTDPPYGLATQRNNDPEKKLPYNGVYRIRGASEIPAGAPPDASRVQLVIKDLPMPNGVAFSPDEKVMYVSNTVPPKWMKYTVRPDGTVDEGAVLYDAAADRGRGAPDGIKVDRQGNVWGSGPGGVWILSPEGKHIGTIPVPEQVANLAWGDDDGKTLYITASTSVYRIRTKVGGVKP